MRDNFEDVDGFVRELVRSSLWGIGYHERKLATDNRSVKMAKKMIEAAGFDFHAMADHKTEEDLYESESFESIESLCHTLVQDRIDNVQHSEESLQQAHKQMAMVKSLLIRGNFVVDFADVQREVQADLDAD